MIHRFAAFNLFAISLLAAAGLAGWLGVIWASDPTYLTAAITLVFAFGWALSVRCAWHRRSVVTRRRFPPDVRVVGQLADRLVMLGLIGTVLGFIIALAGIDPATAGDPSVVSPMVARLLRGMGVAFYTTLVGSVLSIWLEVNHDILVAGDRG